MHAPTLLRTPLLNDGVNDAVTKAATPSKSDSLATEQLIVLGALAAAAAGQGGYYLGPRILITVALLAAGALHCRRHYFRLRSPFVIAAAALCCWAVVSAALARHPGAALPTLSVLASFIVVAMIVGAASTPQRIRMAQTAIAIGAVLALTGWVGVAFRVSRWASPESGLWRATTTVTYTNAAAAVMAALALVVLAMLVDRPSYAGRAAAMILIVGVGATLSRAGIIGLAIGYGIVLVLLGVRRVVGATVGSVVGAAIAAGALTRAMPVTHASRPLVALLGLVVGLAIALAPPLRSPRATNVVVAALAVAIVGAAIGVGLAIHRNPSAVTAGWNERVSAASPTRSEEAHAALALIRAHPVAGVGPGQASFIWTTPAHRMLVDSYAHDEYLQLTVEEGLVGAALLLLLLVAIAVSVERGRRAVAGRSDDSRWLWVGGAVALVYLAGHSGFDFLWHVPVVILVAALALGLCSPPPQDPVPPIPINQPTTTELP